jgi:hypothetical protein
VRDACDQAWSNASIGHLRHAFSIADGAKKLDDPNALRDALFAAAASGSATSWQSFAVSTAVRPIIKFAQAHREDVCACRPREVFESR